MQAKIRENAKTTGITLLTTAAVALTLDIGFILYLFVTGRLGFTGDSITGFFQLWTFTTMLLIIPLIFANLSLTVEDAKRNQEALMTLLKHLNPVSVYLWHLPRMALKGLHVIR